MKRIEPGALVVVDGETREVLRVDGDTIVVRLDGEATGAYPRSAVRPVKED